MSKPTFGPTGEFPQGKLNEHDQGAVKFGIAHEKGKVIIHFGTPVVWIGLDPQQTADLAAVLIKQARAAAREAGIPLTVQL